MAAIRPIPTADTSAGVAVRTYTVERHGRFWKVIDAAGDLVCLTVYKRGAQEVVRRLVALASDATLAAYSRT